MSYAFSEAVPGPVLYDRMLFVQDCRVWVEWILMERRIIASAGALMLGGSDGENFFTV